MRLDSRLLALSAGKIFAPNAKIKIRSDCSRLTAITVSCRPWVSFKTKATDLHFQIEGGPAIMTYRDEIKRLSKMLEKAQNDVDAANRDAELHLDYINHLTGKIYMTMV